MKCTNEIVIRKRGSVDLTNSFLFSTILIQFAQPTNRIVYDGFEELLVVKVLIAELFYLGLIYFFPFLSSIRKVRTKMTRKLWREN